MASIEILITLDYSCAILSLHDFLQKTGFRGK
ncbi:Hypothetical protein, conserved [Brucella abortus str. 2308 A]|uniref:Uncharacterized protein n=3 Tax=Brucella TaxID=234 RepID=A0A0H3GB28_BRUSU|nr:hypothetical protein BR0775 [Brucella suis 1330]ABY37880.1 Hypothetical protein, conserved [Brucella suis ATCC 23445]AEK54102.1 hypothetical protein BPI_I811 [Brucella pinnipedialis B2/94]AEU05789.1 hypothetical protein BSVBI22_A0771 [Brucella suis VBI22]AHN46413.1 hypothetical protein BSS2_I0758 [Brucella suis bv. 1 str. S2]EEH14323.1 Hypothetical protein, conserved [Brucella ceti str. Cudo]EEP64261.1 Hypothetical protein, conserved [Brucella abortus str. 2308 A]EFM62936.1 Hypothetical p